MAPVAACIMLRSTGYEVLAVFPPYDIILRSTGYEVLAVFPPYDFLRFGSLSACKT